MSGASPDFWLPSTVHEVQDPVLHLCLGPRIVAIVVLGRVHP